MAANTIAYGFIKMVDLFNERIDEVGIERVTNAIDATLAEHNRQMAAMMGLFATPTTAPKLRYKTPITGSLQPLDEQGRARPVRPAGYYDVAFPLQDAGTAWGQTYKASKKMTVEEANNIVSSLLLADRRWMRDHMLAALFANASWTFGDDQYGSLTIKGLANSDTDTYLLMAGADSGAADTHYLAQAAAIDNSNDPFPTIYTELMEHPENSGDVVVLVPSGLKATVEALAGFYPQADANLRPGLATTTVAGSLGAAVPGQVIGYHEARVWIAEWRSLPANYMIAVATEGPRPLAMRQEPEAVLQGFNRVAERNDHPFYESQYLRSAGFGANNRVGALVYRIGDAAYAVPTGYASPLA